MSMEHKDLVPGNDDWFFNPPPYPPISAKRYFQPTIGYEVVKACAPRSGIPLLHQQHSLSI